MSKTRLFTLLLLSAPLVALGATAGSPVKPPPEVELVEARKLVERMKNSERGPYTRIRWFCKDGSVLPPTAFACSQRGGGRQHAQYSTERQQLAALGWHVGTVFAALPWEEFWGDKPRRQRLRELPLERFMVDNNDGWVLHHAQHYRGRLQIEDEEAAGRALLLRLMDQREWVAQNLLLVLKLAQTVPQADNEDGVYQVRNLAQTVAERDSSFTRLRIEIHSSPSPDSARRVRAWLAARPELIGELRRDAVTLATGLDELYGEAARQARLKKAEKALKRSLPQVAELLAGARQQAGIARLADLTHAMVILRGRIPTEDPASSLYRINLMQALSTEVRVAASEILLQTDLRRKELLLLAVNLLQGAWASGLLSDGERQALEQPLHTLAQLENASGSEYSWAARRLSLAAGWATLTVRYTFAEALSRYVALDQGAERFIDDTLRASVLLPLGDVAHRLALDGAAVAGLSHHLFGNRTGRLLGINPGVARARLRVMSSEDLARGRQPAADEIAVLPETVAELTPVAGILTLGEGNPLSHVQMLARNLGIPNVVVSPELLTDLKLANGQPVLLAVSADGRVYLERQSDLPPILQSAQRPAASVAPELLAPPTPDLAYKYPIPLAALHAGLSGKVVGPKAANIGELARRFPARIAAAVALPFGVFADYTREQRAQVAAAYSRYRDGKLDQAGLDAVLDRVRGEVSSLSLETDLRHTLATVMERTFGPPGTYGVFVRSDTNVEDLPQFTGAGLNETVPNVVSPDAQLAAIPRVWSSVYSRRAMAWRGRILKHPEQVFASILLMKSIAAEKSGVLVSRNLYGPTDGLTVSTAWGVGGAVDNESAATRVLHNDGGSLLLAEAKAAYQRAVDPNGGVGWIPAPSGPVLTASEQNDLRSLAAEVVTQYPPVLDDEGRPLPWDIEFAFADGKLWLLQIRPLVQRGHVEAGRLIDSVLPEPSPEASVDLHAAPYSTAGIQR